EDNTQVPELMEKVEEMITDNQELRLLLLGWKGVGKSSVGNAILGRRYFESGQETELCLRRQALVSGRRVTIVDTPGWDWFSVRRTPKRIRQDTDNEGGSSVGNTPLKPKRRRNIQQFEGTRASYQFMSMFSEINCC
uniref:AIG1-type G domain-containing protein n=1 Tax=Anabas testudineus TaxID=64144 RepID=A0A7N6FL16_ANATE